MVEVTGGDTDWKDGARSDREWLQTGIDSNYKRLWDDNCAASGYFMRAATDWRSGWGKGFTPTVDAMTTHAILLSLITEDFAHRARMFALSDNIVDHMVAAMPASGVGFPEVHNTDWSIDTSQTVSEPGRQYKTAWRLYRAYLMDPSRTEYKTSADAIMWDMWGNGGYDHVYGGPFSKLIPSTKDSVASGIGSSPRIFIHLAIASPSIHTLISYTALVSSAT